MIKKLPSGPWIYIDVLPLGTTEEEVSSFMAERGMAIPVENISIKDYENRTTAVLSVPHNVVAQLVNWAIDGSKIGKKQVVVQKFGTAGYGNPRPL